MATASNIQNNHRQSELSKHQSHERPILFVSLEKGGECTRECHEMTVAEFKSAKEQWDDNKWGYTASHIVTGEVYARREIDYINIARSIGLKVRDKNGNVLQSTAYENELRELENKKQGFIKDFFAPVFSFFKKEAA
jgi:hypothetical protein